MNVILMSMLNMFVTFFFNFMFNSSKKTLTIEIMLCKSHHEKPIYAVAATKYYFM